MRSGVKGYEQRMVEKELIMIRTAPHSRQGKGYDVIDKQ